jgi:ribosomal protein L11 methyltransferase
VLFFYYIDRYLAVGPPWWRGILSRAPVSIVLRTGGSFPPSHPTTKMCLRLLVQRLKEPGCRHLLDVGCGSGVLALAGLKLGVDRALAVDVSAVAMAVSRSNAELNRLENRLFLVRGSTDAVAGRFDLVLANLPMPVLAEKLGNLVRLAGTGGSVVLSGFQDVDKYLVERELCHQGLRARAWLSAEYSFPAVPPSGSFTWMAVLATLEQRAGMRCDSEPVNRAGAAGSCLSGRRPTRGAGYPRPLG